MEQSEIKNNLIKEKKVLEQILSLNLRMQDSNASERNFFSKAILSLLEQFIIVNNSTREGISTYKGYYSDSLPSANKEKVILGGESITINKEDKTKLLAELQISIQAINKIKQKKSSVNLKQTQTASQFVSFSSKLFLKKSSKFTKSEFFIPLIKNMKKANMSILVSSYISTMLFATILTFLISIFIAVVFAFFTIGYSPGVLFPVFSLVKEGILLRLLNNVLIALILPVIVFFLFYLYPASQASSIKTKIENELPFAIIHMSAIAGSGVEPVKVFNIIATSYEYPAVSSEIKKLMNMINLYGYDLVTSLKEAAKTTSSEKLGAVLTGIANITISGGDLKEYLEKKAADSLLDYKLQMKSEASAAETSMDLYIGVLIAAPLILMVMLVIMGAVPGLGFKGMSTVFLSYLVIGGIALLNIGFLVFLKMKKKS